MQPYVKRYRIDTRKIEDMFVIEVWYGAECLASRKVGSVEELQELFKKFSDEFYL